MIITHDGIKLTAFQAAKHLFFYFGWEADWKGPALWEMELDVDALTDEEFKEVRTCLEIFTEVMRKKFLVPERQEKDK